MPLPTHFTDCGFSEDTEFEVIASVGPFNPGDIVKVVPEESREEALGWAYFKNSNGDVFDLYYARQWIGDVCYPEWAEVRAVHKYPNNQAEK